MPSPSSTAGRSSGESADDNASGMSFSRCGLDQITEAVEHGRIDGVVVKDLSRLGRHRTQTALLIDYLREQGVRMLSATERAISEWRRMTWSSASGA